MTRLTRAFLLLFALTGLVASSLSLQVHHRLLSDPKYTSFCDVSTTVSCSTAYLSPYGSVLGVSVALGGVIFFVFVLLLLFADRWGSPSIAESLAGYVFVCSTVGLAAILYFAYAAFFILKTVCVLCLITYVGVIGLFLVSGIATQTPMISIPRRMIRDAGAVLRRPVAVLIVLLFAVSTASAIAFFPRKAAAVDPVPGLASAPQGSQELRAEFEKWYDSLQKVTVPVPSGGATVLIVKFTDFQCPMCAGTHVEFKPILQKYQSQFPGAVRLVPKMYPLQQDCNVNVRGPYHTAACDSAVAFIMARATGRADALEDWLYTNQTLLSPATVREAARSVGLLQDFNARNPKAIEEIKSDVALASLLNVHSTPTFFINGTVVVGGIAAQYFDMAIAYELRKAGKIK